MMSTVSSSLISDILAAQNPVASTSPTNKAVLSLTLSGISCADISAYIKNGDKIYYAYGFDGHPGFMISKDSKYVVDSLSGGEVTLYKYSKGSYKEVKYYSGDKKKQLKKWKKKYKMYEPKFKVYASWSDL